MYGSVTSLDIVRKLAEQGHEMAAGGTAPGGKAIGIQAVFYGVSPQPAHGSFAILDLGRENCVLAEAVIDAGNRVAL